jgi:hypothetical protein
LWKNKNEILEMLHPSLVGELPDANEQRRDAKTGVLLSQLKARQANHSREKNLKTLRVATSNTNHHRHHQTTPYQYSVSYSGT